MQLQAPFASTPTKPNDTTAIRLQMKFKGTVTEHCHGCLIMVVLGAEIIGPQSLIIDPIATHSLSWVELVLVLPRYVVYDTLPCVFTNRIYSA